MGLRHEVLCLVSGEEANCRCIGVSLVVSDDGTEAGSECTHHRNFIRKETAMDPSLPHLLLHPKQGAAAAVDDGGDGKNSLHSNDQSFFGPLKNSSQITHPFRRHQKLTVFAEKDGEKND